MPLLCDGFAALEKLRDMLATHKDVAARMLWLHGTIRPDRDRLKGWVEVDETMAGGLEEPMGRVWGGFGCG